MIFNTVMVGFCEYLIPMTHLSPKAHFPPAWWSQFPPLCPNVPHPVPQAQYCRSVLNCFPLESHPLFRLLYSPRRRVTTVSLLLTLIDLLQKDALWTHLEKHGLCLEHGSLES